MHYQEWRQKLEAGEILSPVYLFYGSRDDLQQEAIGLLKSRTLVPGSESWNYTIISAPEVGPQDLWPKLCAPAWGGGSRLLVLTDLAKNPKLEQVALEYLQQSLHPSCLVCLGNTKGPLYRALQPRKAAVEFTTPSRDELERLLQERAAAQGVTLEPAAAGYLATLEDPWEELEKTCLYIYPSRQVTLAAVQEVATANPASSIFHLVDAIGERRVDKAIGYLRHLLAAREPPVRIVFMIARQFGLLARAKGHLPAAPAVLAKELGVPPFVATKLQRQARQYSWEELRAVQQSLPELDRQLKTGSDATVALELFIISLAKNIAKN